MAVTKEQVAKIYVATFDRAPDAAGLEYWVNSGLTIEQIAESFFDQDETHEKYPDTLSTAEFVNAIYNNLFNRDADPDGLVYWTNEIESGNISRADMIIAIVNGAQGDDAKILDNKTEVGLYFAEQGLNDHDKAVDIMSGITADSGSVSDAKSLIDDWADSAAKFDLTTDADNLEGTDGDDSFYGKVGDDALTTTYQAIDSIDGKGGDDILKLNLDISSGYDSTNHNKTIGAPTIKNIENVIINNTSEDGGVDTNYDTVVVDLKNYDSSIKDLTVKGDGSAFIQWGTGTANESQQNILDNITLSGKGLNHKAASGTDQYTAVKVSVIYNNSVVTGSADASAITLTNEVEQSFLSKDTSNNGAIETYTIHTAEEGKNQTLTLSDAKTKKVIVDGGANLTLTDGASSGSITTLDASSATGDITFTQSKNSAATFTGGAGDDKLTTKDGDDSSAAATGDKIDGGAGNDTIKAGAGANEIHGGEGDDTVTTTGGADKIYGESGNDTITAGDGDNTVDGGSGDDNITTGTGADKITGGLGDDTIQSGTGADTIDAGDGKDTIDAGAGADTITGGKGADKITTGNDNDTIKYANSGDTGATLLDMDEITDFTSSSDKIDFDTLAAASGSGSYNDNAGSYDSNTTDSDNFVKLTKDGSAGFATFDLAKAAANDVFADSHYNFIYAFANTTDHNGYLFVDSDQDGTVDEAIEMSTTSTTDVALVAGDIIE